MYSFSLLSNFSILCSEVDPIIASFSGGAVGVISALMVVEVNNVRQQEHKRCKYCLGTGKPKALDLCLLEIWSLNLKFKLFIVFFIKPNGCYTPVVVYVIFLF